MFSHLRYWQTFCYTFQFQRRLAFHQCFVSSSNKMSNFGRNRLQLELHIVLLQCCSNLVRDLKKGRLRKLFHNQLKQESKVLTQNTALSTLWASNRQTDRQHFLFFHRLIIWIITSKLWRITCKPLNSSRSKASKSFISTIQQSLRCHFSCELRKAFSGKKLLCS